MMRQYYLSAEEERLASAIVQASVTVHKALGPGLLESIYEVCFCHELAKSGVSYQRQVVLPIQYDGILFEEGLRLDVLVEDCIICELKAVDELHPVHQAQLISHLKLARKHLGFLLNFHIPIMKQGIKRVVV